MISIKEIIFGLKEIEKIKEQINYIPGPGEILGLDFGTLNDSFDSTYDEVSFLKGTKELIETYMGNKGQLVIDEVNNDVYIMKGNGDIGGIKLLKDGEGGNSIYETINVQIKETDWANDNLTGLKSFTITHNLNSNLEDLEIKFYNVNSNILLSYDVVDKNNIKVYSDTGTYITAIIKAYKNNKEKVSVHGVEEGSWVEENTIFCCILEHNKNISLENIDVKFYNGESNVLLNYEFVSNNSIKIYSDSRVNITIILRKVV